MRDDTVRDIIIAGGYVELSYTQRRGHSDNELGGCLTPFNNIIKSFGSGVFFVLSVAMVLFSTSALSLFSKQRPLEMDECGAVL